MAITVRSPIAGPSMPESLDEALAYVRAHGQPDDFTIAYVKNLYGLCNAIGLRFELAFSQWCDETDVGRSTLWRTRHNPAGIGALPDGTYVGITYETPSQSALGHLVHLWLYVKGTTLPEPLKPYVHLDPRWDIAIEKGKAASAPTLAGLASSWATNPNYAVQIAAHANRAFGVLPERASDMAEPLTFGKVPKPPYIDDYVKDFSGMGAHYVGKRMVLGVVWHRMVGTLEGTRSHFRSGDGGLTDYGVGVAGPDRAAIDGVIYRWNNPLGERTGFASGPVQAPWGDGLAFLNEFRPKYGVNIVNRGQVSIEISGRYETPLTPKARAAIVALTAYYADQARIPWSEFPNWPGHDYSFVRWHQEFTGPAFKVCPGGVVINETATMIAMVKARLKQYQLGAVPEPVTMYAPLALPSWLADDVSKGLMRDHELGTRMAYGAERVYKALRKTRRLQHAHDGAKSVGPDIVAGETFRGSHYIDSGYVLTPHGTRVKAGDLTPEVIIKPRAL